MEEFPLSAGLSHFVPWSDVLKTLFCLGLDDNLVGQVPAPAISCSLAQYIDYVMLLCGTSLTVGEVDETPITTLSRATLFMSVLESVPGSTTVHKSAPAFCPEYVPETMIPRTLAKRRKQRRSKQSVSAPACLPESVHEQVPIVSNRFVPESSNESTLAFRTSSGLAGQAGRPFRGSVCHSFYARTPEDETQTKADSTSVQGGRSTVEVSASSRHPGNPNSQIQPE